MCRTGCVCSFVCVCVSISKDRQQTSSAYVKGAASACPCLPHCLTSSSLPASACVGCMNFKCLCQGAAEAEAEAVAIVRHWQSGTRHFMQDVPGLNPSIYRAHVLNLTCYSFPALFTSFSWKQSKAIALANIDKLSPVACGI